MDIFNDIKKPDIKHYEPNDNSLRRSNSTITKESNQKANDLKNIRKRVGISKKKTVVDSEFEENKTNDKKVNGKDNPHKKEAVSSVDEKGNVDEKDNSEMKNETDDKKNKVIEELALILNIPISEVEKILSELDFTLDALQEKENLLQFVSTAFDATENIDLLNIEGIKDKMIDIEDTINLYLEEGKEINNEVLFTSTETKTNIEVDKPNDSIEEMNIESNEKVELNDFIKTEDPQSFYDESLNDNTNNITHSNTEKVVNVSETSFGQGNFNDQSDDANLDFVSDDLNHISNIGITSEIVFDDMLINKTSLSNSVKTVNKNEVIQQIISKFKLDVGEPLTSIRITLHPETLGDVSLKVVTEDGIVTAQFIAENESVKEVIESGFADLKQMLNEQGIEVSSLSVSVGGDNNQNDSNEFFQKDKKSSKRINEILSSQGMFEEEKLMDDYELDVHDASVNYIA